MVLSPTCSVATSVQYLPFPIVPRTNVQKWIRLTPAPLNVQLTLNGEEVNMSTVAYCA